MLSANVLQIGGDKQQSRELAIEHYPEMAAQLSRVKARVGLHPRVRATVGVRGRDLHANAAQLRILTCSECQIRDEF